MRMDATRSSLRAARARWRNARRSARQRGENRARRREETASAETSGGGDSDDGDDDDTSSSGRLRFGGAPRREGRESSSSVSAVGRLSSARRASLGSAPGRGFRPASLKRASLIVTNEGASRVIEIEGCQQKRPTPREPNARSRVWAFSHTVRIINATLERAETEKAPFERATIRPRPRSGVSRATHGRDARIPAPRAVRERRVAMDRRVGSRRRAEAQGLLDASPSRGACDRRARPTENISRLRQRRPLLARAQRRLSSPATLSISRATPWASTSATPRLADRLLSERPPSAPRLRVSNSPSPCPRCPPR